MRLFFDPENLIALMLCGVCAGVIALSLGEPNISHAVDGATFIRSGSTQPHYAPTPKVAPLPSETLTRATPYPRRPVDHVLTGQPNRAALHGEDLPFSDEDASMTAGPFGRTVTVCLF